jgi:hypothetical protein
MFPQLLVRLVCAPQGPPRAGPRLPLAVDNQRKSGNTWTTHPVIADDPQHERTTVLVTGQLGRAHVYKIDWTGFSSA